jgi:hypothetical protein
MRIGTRSESFPSPQIGEAQERLRRPLVVVAEDALPKRQGPLDERFRLIEPVLTCEHLSELVRVVDREVFLVPQGLTARRETVPEQRLRLTQPPGVPEHHGEVVL